jgi:phospholipid-binding lipoprotein MlaA
MKKLLLLSFIFLISCSTQDNKDPYESVNRKIFVFNDGLDTYILKPAAEVYQDMVADDIKKGVGNFFQNLGEPATMTNNVLQGKLAEAGSDLSRFLINSTFGLFGLMDVAKDFDLQPNNEDFGQTLGAWGVPSGPYIVIPFLGPSTVRDGLAQVVDFYNIDPKDYIEALDCEPVHYCLNIPKALNSRAAFLSAEKMISGDKYIFLRNAYLDNREFKVKDGQVVDDF